MRAQAKKSDKLVKNGGTAKQTPAKTSGASSKAATSRRRPCLRVCIFAAVCVVALVTLLHISVAALRKQNVDVDRVAPGGSRTPPKQQGKVGTRTKQQEMLDAGFVPPTTAKCQGREYDLVKEYGAWQTCGWESRYATQAPSARFDFFVSWTHPVRRAADDEIAPLSELLRPYLGQDPKILTLGCGNSDLAESMYADGFQRIVNTDIAKNLVDSLRTWFSRRAPRMQFLTMNATELSFGENSFDVVLEKGVVEILTQEQMILASLEAYRVLKPGGTFLSITQKPEVVSAEALVPWKRCDRHVFYPTQGTRRAATYLHACERP